MHPKAAVSWGLGLMRLPSFSWMLYFSAATWASFVHWFLLQIWPKQLGCFIPVCALLDLGWAALFLVVYWPTFFTGSPIDEYSSNVSVLLTSTFSCIFYLPLNTFYKDIGYPRITVVAVKANFILPYFSSSLHLYIPLWCPWRPHMPYLFGMTWQETWHPLSLQLKSEL